MDGEVSEVPEHENGEVRRVLRTVALFATALALTGSAQGATGDGVKLARALKVALQHTYKSNGSDDVFTKVTCVLPNAATTGHCKAYFTSASLRETGWFPVKASINRTTGGVRWQLAKPTCKDSKTGAPVAC
jgi:hypothetical protein